MAFLLPSSALLLRASAAWFRPRSSSSSSRSDLVMMSAGARRPPRPTPRGHAFRRLGSSSDDSDFVPINPQTLNWKVGPDQDVFISALSQNGHVNVKVISAKNMMQAIKDKRELSGVATELLGRVMLSTILVANGMKDEETMQLTFNGNGAAKGVMAISDGACNVRAWIGNSDLDDLRDPETGKADIKAAVGKGTLQVVKNHPSWRIPYNGVTELVSGEIAPDVAFYLASSEQRNTAIGVGCHVDPVTGTVESAGGWVVEMLPGVEEESILKLEVNLAVLKEMWGSLDPGQLFAGVKPMTPYKLVKTLLDGLGVGMAEETVPAYRCTCSKEKVFRALNLMGEEEVEDILAKEGIVEAKCEFCAEVYRLNREQLLELRDAALAEAEALAKNGPAKWVPK